MSSPPVARFRACADGFGRVRYFRARRVPAGFLVLAASIFLLVGAAPPAAAQFPIRQLPPSWGLPRQQPSVHTPANALPFAQAGSNAPLTADQSPTPPLPAVARIVVPEKDGVSFGSGTLVDARGQFGLVITNWHVVRDAAGQIGVEFPDGFKSPAEVVKTDKDWDLAALSVMRPKVSPLPVTSTAPQPGEWLTIGGYGSGNWRVASGQCTQYLAPGVEFPHEMVEIATEARQGDSGGPILNQRGELAGVLFGSGPGYTSGSYGGRVLKFLATVIPGSAPGIDEPPQIASLHAGEPPASPFAPAPHDDQDRPPFADRDLSPDTAAATPALLAPPPKNDLNDRFGPLNEGDELDPRVAVSNDRSDPTSAVTSSVSSELTAQSPILLDTSLAPRNIGSATSGDLNRAPPAQLVAALWKQVGGTSTADQAKTVFAGIGLLALLIMFWRVGSRKEPEGDQEY